MGVLKITRTATASSSNCDCRLPVNEKVSVYLCREYGADPSPHIIHTEKARNTYGTEAILCHMPVAMHSKL